MLPPSPVQKSKLCWGDTSKLMLLAYGNLEVGDGDLPLLLLFFGGDRRSERLAAASTATTPAAASPAANAASLNSLPPQAWTVAAEARPLTLAELAPPRLLGRLPP